MGINLILGDALEVVRGLADESFAACFCDPPYGLKFMGKEWDHGVPSKEVWAEVLRVLKPGAILMAFGGTRTWHRLAVAIEDAGFEMFDTMMWLYGSGFPKSHSIGKALDKHGGKAIAWFGPWLRQERKQRGIAQKELARHFLSKTGGLTGCVANWELSLNIPTAEQFNKLCDVLDLPFEHIEEAEREVVGQYDTDMGGLGGQRLGQSGGDITAPATDAAKTWEGYGTALKPAWEPVIASYRPLTAEQFLSILVEMIRSQLCQFLSADDVEKSFTGIQAKPSEVLRSVPEVVRIYALANSGNVRFVASHFMCRSRESNEEKDDSALQSVKENGNPNTTWENGTLPGRVDAFLSQLLDISMSDATASISVNTVLSWNTISDALLNQANTFTTTMGIRLTTALRTLSLFLSQIISGDTGNSSPSLSPNWEPILLARKPRRATYAQTAMEHGTACLNIDGCRVRTDDKLQKLHGSFSFSGSGGANETGKRIELVDAGKGRWPANLLLSHSDCERVGVKRVKGSQKPSTHKHAGWQNEYVGGKADGELPCIGYADPDGLETVAAYHCAEGCAVAALDRQSGVRPGFRGFRPGVERKASRGKGGYHGNFPDALTSQGQNDTGGASRFFQTFEGERFRYVSKANRKERDMGLEGMQPMSGGEATDRRDGSAGIKNPRAGAGRTGGMRNPHPTVKPLALCEYLARLIVPPPEYREEAKLLIPFCGSGSECIGALMAGWRNVTGIDIVSEYLEIAELRIAAYMKDPKQMTLGGD